MALLNAVYLLAILSFFVFGLMKQLALSHVDAEKFKATRLKNGRISWGNCPRELLTPKGKKLMRASDIFLGLMLILVLTSWAIGDMP